MRSLKKVLVVGVPAAVEGLVSGARSAGWKSFGIFHNAPRVLPLEDETLIHFAVMIQPGSPGWCLEP